MNHWILKFQSFVQGRKRIALAWIFSLWLVLSAREVPALPGLTVAFLGATLRFWASGFLFKDSQMAIGGPYRMTRNPLYFGTYLIAIGVAWSTENYVLLAVISIFYALIYHFIIVQEEDKLLRLFGKSYKRYCAKVPRFFPRPFPISESDALEVNPDTEILRFSFKQAWKNKAYEAYAAFIAFAAFLWGMSWIWKTIGKTADPT